MILYCEKCKATLVWAGTCQPGEEPWHGPCKIKLLVVRALEELVAQGGKFYKMGDESWCDTPLNSWKLIQGVGYVCQ